MTICAPGYTFTRVGTNKADGRADIRVDLSKFNTDPQGYIRKATTERRVLVYHDGTQQISAAFGGSLDVSPLDD